LLPIHCLLISVATAKLPMMLSEPHTTAGDCTYMNALGPIGVLARCEPIMIAASVPRAPPLTRSCGPRGLTRSNEIDAVGIEDADGNVQWANHAQASTTYAER